MLGLVRLRQPASRSILCAAGAAVLCWTVGPLRCFASAPAATGGHPAAGFGLQGREGFGLQGRPITSTASANSMAGTVIDGKRVAVHYTGTLEDGSVFDSSEVRPLGLRRSLRTTTSKACAASRYSDCASSSAVPDLVQGKAPLEFDVGGGNMIKGFDAAVRGMVVGESKTVTLAPAEAYGEFDDSKMQEVDVSRLPEGCEVGTPLQAGQQRVVVVKIEEGVATLDANHELAGKTLTFEILVSAITDPPEPFRVPEMLLTQNPYDYPRQRLPRYPRDLLEGVEFPLESIFTPGQQAAMFSREDESDDGDFYTQPRFLTHIDDEAIAALTAHYSRVLPPTPAGGNDIGHLDVCSSWVSFLPTDYSPRTCVGLGMNDAELAANEQLSSYDVHDLNLNPVLPYDDEAFDVITNVVSVDYLAKPLELFEEMERVLKPGGLAIMSFSNRMFWTKAIKLWTESNEYQRVLVCSGYFRYTRGFGDLEAFEITLPNGDNPMFVVQARKTGGEAKL